jgi:hypothetical protein
LPSVNWLDVGEDAKVQTAKLQTVTCMGCGGILPTLMKDARGGLIR